MRPPAPSDLKASAEWLKWKFGVKAQARGALHHVRRCLDEIASREYDFLMFKATLLAYLEEWSEFKYLLGYLQKRYPNDAEVLYQQAEFYFSHGKWREALRCLKRAELRIKKEQLRSPETLYFLKLECLTALGNIPNIEREAKRILKKSRRYSFARTYLGRSLRERLTAATAHTRRHGELNSGGEKKRSGVLN